MTANITKALNDINIALENVESVLDANKPPEVQEIQDKIEIFCDMLSQMNSDEAKKYTPELEQIGHRVQAIYERIKIQRDIISDKIGGIKSTSVAHQAYLKTTGFAKAE